MSNLARRSAAIAIAALLGASCTSCVGRTDATRTGHYDHIRLCAPANTAKGSLTRARTIVAGRLRAFPKLVASVNRADRRCLDVRLAQTTKRRQREVRQVLEEKGVVLVGAMLRHSSQLLYNGQRVDYAGQLPKGSKEGLPVVRPLFWSSSVVPGSVNLLPGPAVSMKLRGRDSLMWSRWTQRNVGRYSPDIVDHVVVDDPTAANQISSGLFVITPYGSFRFRARAIWAYLRFGPLPFRWH